MRILLVHSYYRLRGGEDVVFEAEAEMLATFGHEVRTYTRYNSELLDQGRLTNFTNTIWNRKVANEISDLVREHRIEIVHFHNTFPAISPLAIQAAHEAGAVTVQTLHNSRKLCAAGVCYRDHQPCTKCVRKSFALPAILHGCYHDNRMATAAVVLKNWLHRTNRTFEKYLDVAIAPTHFVRERYEDSDYPISRIVVKPHFVERDLECGDGRGGFALFVGRLSEEKGVRTLLDAWPRLRNRLPLKVIGQGPLEAELIALADRSAANSGQDIDRNEIEYLGQLSQTEVYAAMGDAAVLILPSHCAESFGRVVIEAFAKGTPVICANQGGQAELVHPGVGATFRSGDADDLARVIDELISESSLMTDGSVRPHFEILNAMRPVARLEYETHYNALINHERLQQIYSDAMARRWPHLEPSPKTSQIDEATEVFSQSHSLAAVSSMAANVPVSIHDDVNGNTNHKLGRRTSTGP
jgi:glycosyltransferase involved in cell wall biosynthesis